MKLYKTEKLFYNTYVCKIVFYNDLATIFRNKNLKFARQQLDVLQQLADENKTLRHPRRVWSNPITLEDFQTACVLYDCFRNTKSKYMLRVEGFTINLYTNDYNWIKFVLGKVNCIEAHFPENEKHANILLQDIDLVTKAGPDNFMYKVYLDDFVDPSFANFCRNNTDKIKIGDVAVRAIETKQFVRGYYFWAKNDKILNLASLACGCKFKRVLKHVDMINTDAEE